MNKNQGLLAGTLLSAAVLVRVLTGGSVSTTVTTKPAADNSTAPHRTTPRGKSEEAGPWTASCKYWAGSAWTTQDDQSDGSSGSGAKQSLAVKGSPFNAIDIFANGARIDIDTDAEDTDNGPSCASSSDLKLKDDRWGFPAESSAGDKPDITALIAIVPDPVHTHLSLGFDRTIQAYLQAAFDSNYVSGAYWLPWKANPGNVLASEATGGKEPGHNEEREHQPGIIILKQIPHPSTRSDLLYGPTESYYKTVYLFLVAESPTEGVDGFQMKNALAEEDELGRMFPKRIARFSTGSDGKRGIIGPTFTGSAASLRATIDSYCNNKGTCGPSSFSIAGATQTLFAARQLMITENNRPPNIEYISFDAHVQSDLVEFFRIMGGAGEIPERIAVLSEDDTAFGSQGLSAPAGYVTSQPPLSHAWDPQRKTLYMFFPREISALRNTPIQSPSSSGDTSAGTVPSPYLHFSVKDPNAQDSVVQFSKEHSPLSQESQLMEIAREFHRRRIQVIALSASDPLDMIFLAQFFRRACPDARLVFVDSDLLMARDADNLPYVGSITISPYTFMTRITRRGGESGRTYTDTASEALYNAARYILANSGLTDTKDSIQEMIRNSRSAPFQGYRLPSDNSPNVLLSPPPLWATTLGTDGYYPLAIVTPCSSSPGNIYDKDGYSDPFEADLMPQLKLEEGRFSPVSTLCDPVVADQPFKQLINGGRGRIETSISLFPSLQWNALCAIAGILCLFHSLMLWVADYDSPMTHDLAVKNNDRPRRRSMYIHFSTAAITSMTAILVIPLVALSRAIAVERNCWLWVSFVSTCVVAAVVAALCNTWTHAGWSGEIVAPEVEASGEPGGFRLLVEKCKSVLQIASRNIFFFLNLTALGFAVGVPIIWWRICLSNTHITHSIKPFPQSDLVGFAFAYRCICPESGVSPVVPMLLILLGWYLWALFQTWRMRFADTETPREVKRDAPWLPKRLSSREQSSLFVANEDLASERLPHDDSLYKNLSCFLITRRMIRRIFGAPVLSGPTPVDGMGWRQIRGLGIDLSLVAGSAAVFGWFVFDSPFTSIDHYFRGVGSHRSAPFEALLAVLFLPLFWCSFSGWLRLLFVWISLKKLLLERLENLPLRFAFSRLQGKGWMTVLSRVGLQEQRRDLDRCIESMRQMLHLPDLKRNLADWQIVILDTASKKVLKTRQQMLGFDQPQSTANDALEGHDLTRRIQTELSDFSQQLLSILLIPFWQNKRTGLVESNEIDSVPIKARRPESEDDASRASLELHAGPTSEDPPRILASEEFLAMRYMSLIRAVLGNMRYMMTFFSITFVLTVVAWNSYPFQPRELVDWVFTLLLLVLGFGVIWVFAQMHRDPILSRVTATRPNELGWDFYLRIVAYGAIPVFTWLAYQFPEIGGTIYKFMQPGTSVFR